MLLIATQSCKIPHFFGSSVNSEPNVKDRQTNRYRKTVRLVNTDRQAQAGI